jgi:hypothetical protein
VIDGAAGGGLLAAAGDRPAADVLARVVRVSLGGTVYELRVRSIRANREWKARLDSEIVTSLHAIDAADDGNVAAVIAALEPYLEPLLDVLLAYDADGVLPSKDAILDIEPDATLEIFVAIREVWRAASPFVGMALAALTSTTPEPTTSGSSTPTSTSPRSTAGSRGRSRKN